MAPGPDLDHEMVEEYQEQIGTCTFKQELMDISLRILALKEDDTSLARQESGISQLIVQAKAPKARLPATSSQGWSSQVRY